MSWITNLAGKAESLLEQVDGAAKTALKNNETQDPVQGHASFGNKEPETVQNLAPKVHQGNIPRTASEGSLHAGKILKCRYDENVVWNFQC